MYRHLIIPTDGSEAGTRAVEHGLDLARAVGAKVTILTVLQPFHTFSLDPDMLTETPAVHRQHLDEHVRDDDRLEQTLQASGVTYAHLRARHDHLGEAVTQAAEAQGCDLIVMPAHERYGLLGRSLDSETVKVLSKSRLPVLVVH
jgi:nucleotide-binding universal stress UspA family protein